MGRKITVTEMQKTEPDGYRKFVIVDESDQTNLCLWLPEVFTEYPQEVRRSVEEQVLRKLLRENGLIDPERCAECKGIGLVGKHYDGGTTITACQKPECLEAAEHQSQWELEHPLESLVEISYPEKYTPCPTPSPSTR